MKKVTQYEWLFVLLFDLSLEAEKGEVARLFVDKL